MRDYLHRHFMKFYYNGIFVEMKKRAEAENPTKVVKSKRFSDLINKFSNNKKNNNTNNSNNNNNFNRNINRKMTTPQTLGNNNPEFVTKNKESMAQGNNNK